MATSIAAASSDARTAATCAESRSWASVKSATRRKPSSCAWPPASARQPAPKVKAGLATAKDRSLSSVRVKSAWQQDMFQLRLSKVITAPGARSQGRAVGPDQIGGLFGHHDHRQVGVAGGERGHDAAID